MKSLQRELIYIDAAVMLALEPLGMIGESVCNTLPKSYIFPKMVDAILLYPLESKRYG